jgi:hypothetical protein
MLNPSNETVSYSRAEVYASVSIDARGSPEQAFPPDRYDRFPRVQELAVIAANLTYGCPDPLPVRVETIAELYSAAAPVPLTPVERDALRAFAHAAAAMESPLPVSGLLPVPRRAWRWRWRRHSHEPGRASHTGLAVAA